MYRLFRFWALACLIALAAASASAETFQLTDGTTVSGELVSPNELGVLLRLPDGNYSDRIAWAKFSQTDLKKISENARMKPLVEPFIEVPEEEMPQKEEIPVRPVPRLEQPTTTSFLGAFASSSVGLAILFLLYVANLYAAYEIAMVRAYSAVLGCGVATVLPVVGPLIFLCLPTRAKTQEHAQAEMAAAQEAHAQAAAVVAKASAGIGAAAHQAAAPKESELPPTQIFRRGDFVFNRRFFETKFAGFFGVLRREADKDMVLTLKSARGLFVVERFTRITANEMYVQVQRGASSMEMSIPFLDVQEIELRHKAAPATITDR